MSPKTFLGEVLTVRLPNCFLPDTPQRIATDTSQKLSIRFGETIKAYLEKGMDVSNLKGIALVEAGWLRYLMGVDDNGSEMAISPDPRLDEMKSRLAGRCPSAITRTPRRRLRPSLRTKASSA